MCIRDSLLSPRRFERVARAFDPSPRTVIPANERIAVFILQLSVDVFLPSRAVVVRQSSFVPVPRLRALSRASVRSLSRTSVCSIAMFMYPSRHASTPASVRRRSSVSRVRVRARARSDAPRSSISFIHLASPRVDASRRASVIHARVQLHQHRLPLDRLEEIRGRFPLGRAHRRSRARRRVPRRCAHS